MVEQAYSGLVEQGFESCDLIGDFFMSPVIKRALGDLWNDVCMPGEELDDAKDFDIYSTKHLSFLRIVGTEDLYAQKFLINVRKRGLQLKNIGQLKYESQHITTFILLWEDFRYRLKHSTESMSGILSDAVKDSVYHVGSETAYIIQEENTGVTKFQSINSLTTEGISPIDENGEAIYLVNDFGELYGFYDVVNNSGQKYYIDKNGRVIGGEDLDQKRIEGSNQMIRLYQDCILMIQGQQALHFPAMRVLREVTSLDFDGSGDKEDDLRTAITEFEKRMQVLRASHGGVQLKVIDCEAHNK